MELKPLGVGYRPSLEDEGSEGVDVGIGAKGITSATGGLSLATDAGGVEATIVEAALEIGANTGVSAAAISVGVKGGASLTAIG